MAAQAKKKGDVPDAVRALVVNAAKRIAERREDTEHETAKRALGKLRRLRPTDRMNALLAYIRARGSVPFMETLGMDWRFLGGLLSRGVLTWDGRTLKIRDRE